MSENKELEFSLLLECSNPMEAELVPATLREREIPHRTEWSPAGTLRIFVPTDWLEDAQEALEYSRRVFFGAPPAASAKNEEAPHPAVEPPIEDNELEEEFGSQADWSLQDDGLYPEEDLKLRPIWPAWALAAIPGLGLGHLYAGKFQIFIYLVFASALGAVIYSFTRAPAAFLLVALAWVADLGFAAFHVKEHNRRAERLRLRMRQKEEQFLKEVTGH